MRRAGAAVGSRLLAGVVGWAVLGVVASASGQHGTDGEWHVHGGENGYTRYAPLDQINAETVEDLEVVWRRQAVDASLHARWPDLRYSNQLRSTPIMVDGVLYASNGIGMVEAFDPASGETIWVQEIPFLSDDETPRGAANRGVGYWPGEEGEPARILSVRSPYLFATDVETGRPIDGFGDGGKIDLRVFADSPESQPFNYISPPLVVRDVVVVGQLMEDHPRTKDALRLAEGVAGAGCQLLMANPSMAGSLAPQVKSACDMLRAYKALAKLGGAGKTAPAVPVARKKKKRRRR